MVPTAVPMLCCVLVCFQVACANDDLAVCVSLLVAVCETTVALVVRKGNPKNVRTWEDLLQPGLQVKQLHEKL